MVNLFKVNAEDIKIKKKTPQGRFQIFWKGGGRGRGGSALSATMVGRRRKFFRWSKNVKITLETISFLVKYFFQYFQIFSIFIYNESLPMKSCQFFKIYKRFYKEREIILIQQSMRKKTEKKWNIRNSNIRKQHSTVNIQIRVHNRYRRQYITNGKNWRKWKFSPKKKDDVITQNGGPFRFFFSPKTPYIKVRKVLKI